MPKYQAGQLLNLYVLDGLGRGRGRCSAVPLSDLIRFVLHVFSACNLAIYIAFLSSDGQVGQQGRP